MPNVFLPSIPSRYDPVADQRVSSIPLAPISNFGNLVPLTEMQKGFNQEDINEAINSISATLSERYDPAEDFVVTMGDPILIAAAIKMASDHAQETGDVVKILRWDNSVKQYEQIEVVL